MLKPGLKRRKTAREAQNERDQLRMRETQLNERVASLLQMEEELLNARQAADNNRGAYDQLTRLISKGKIHQRPDGTCYADGDDPEQE